MAMWRRRPSEYFSTSTTAAQLSSVLDIFLGVSLISSSPEAAMEVDSTASVVPLQQVQQTVATVLCYNCGVPIDGTTAAGALCEECVKLTIDASQGIQREAVLHTCPDCDRWLSPPSQWL